MKALFDHVRENGFWMPAPIMGQYDGMLFTHDDYLSVVADYISELEAAPDVGTYFTTKIITIRRDGTTFVLRLMDGQGTEIDIFTKEHFLRAFPEQAKSLK